MSNVRDGCLSVVAGRSKGEGDEGVDGGPPAVGGKRRAGVGFVNAVGYDTAGMHGAIGVFLWDTDSEINQAVQNGVVFGGGDGNVTRGPGAGPVAQTS